MPFPDQVSGGPAGGALIDGYMFSAGGQNLRAKMRGQAAEDGPVIHSDNSNPLLRSQLDAKPLRAHAEVLCFVSKPKLLLNIPGTLSEQGPCPLLYLSPTPLFSSQDKTTVLSGRSPALLHFCCTSHNSSFLVSGNLSVWQNLSATSLLSLNISRVAHFLTFLTGIARTATLQDTLEWNHRLTFENAF